MDQDIVVTTFPCSRCGTDFNVKDMTYLEHFGDDVFICKTCKNFLESLDAEYLKPAKED